MLYVADTHSLIWFLTNDTRLGKRAAEVFRQADRSNVIIVLPIIVLAEAMYICESKNAGIAFSDILKKLEFSTNYVVHNLDLSVLKKAHAITQLKEIHDRIIIATTQQINAKMITKDEEIVQSKSIETIW